MIYPGIQPVFPGGVHGGVGAPGFVSASRLTPGYTFRTIGGVDIIGKSISELYPLVDPALRSIISADGGATKRADAEIVTLALASPLLNGSTMCGSEAEGIVFYNYLTTPVVAPATILTKACRVMGAIYTPPAGPNAFSFTDATGAELSTLTESNTITLAGSTVALPFSVTDGQAQINGAGDWVTSGMAPAGCTIKLRLTTSGSYETAVGVILSINGASDTFSVTTRANVIKFTVIGYSAAWTPPSITAATLSDANVVWTRPDLTTFSGKTPAMTNFSQLGEYRCAVANWAAVTSFSFNPGTIQAWISTINIVEFLPLMTALTSPVLRNISSLNIDISSLRFPSSITNLALFLRSCAGITGSISGWVLPPSTASLQGVLDGNTEVTGIFPSQNALVSCTNYATLLYSNLRVACDISTFTWRSNISDARFASNRFTYGTGQALRSNVKNGILFGLDNCALPAADVGRVLIDINMSGATGVGGSIALNSNNTAPVWGTEAEPSGVAYAVADLIAKNWSSIAVTGGIPAWVLAL